MVDAVVTGSQKAWMAETLPAALEWLWNGYAPAAKGAQPAR